MSSPSPITGRNCCDTCQKSGGVPCYPSRKEDECSRDSGKCHFKKTCCEPKDVVDVKSLQTPIMCGEGKGPTPWDMYPRLTGQSHPVCDFGGPNECCDGVDIPKCHVHNPHKDLYRTPAKFPLHEGKKLCQWFAAQQGVSMCDRLPPKQVPPPIPFENLQSETGRFGVHQSQLNYPHYLDARGSEIVVSECDSCRIQLISQQGGKSRVLPYGKRGSGFDHLDSPAGVAYLATTGCYVAAADTRNQRVVFLKMNLDDHGYGHLSEIHTAGTGILDAPMGLYHDPRRQSFLITDISHRDPKVTYHDLDGRIVNTHRPCSTNPLVRPTDVACDVYGRSYVTDTVTHTVNVFDSNGKYLFHFGGPGLDEGQFNQPSGVCVDRRGNVMVCDQLNNRIQMFAPDGRFIRFVTTDCYVPRGICESKHGLLAVATGDPYAFLKYFYVYPWEGGP